jgi:hypothetical protein
MKRLFVGALVLTLWSAASGETGTALLARMPLPPGNLCDPSPEPEKQFRDQLNAVDRDIQAELRARNKEQKAYAKQHEAEWRDQMMKQSGLSQEQIDQAKAAQKSPDRKARAAAKRKIAEQALEQYADLTIDEARQLKVPDKKGKERTQSAIADPKTQAYAAQEMATAQAKAAARTPEEQATDEKKRKRFKDLADLADQQKKLLDATMAGREVVGEKMRDLESKAQAMRENSIVPIQRQIEDYKEQIRRISEASHQRNKGTGQEEESDASRDARAAENEAAEKKCSEIRQEIERLELSLTEVFGQYCASFSAPYCTLLGDYLTWCRSAQAGLDRYEEMENEKFKLQTDTTDVVLLKTPGALGIQEAAACVDLMKSAFKYAEEYRSWKRATTKSTDGAEP